VTLQEVTAQPRARQQRRLEVDLALLLQPAEIGAPQGLGRNADLERVAAGGQLGDGQTGAVDADGIAEFRVVQNAGAVGDGEGVAAAARGGAVEGRDGGDCLPRVRWNR